MATSTISGLTAVLAGDLGDAALIEVEDTSAHSRKATIAQLRTQIFTPARAVDLLFVDNLYDIGKSGATRPRDIFASRNGTFGGTLNVVGVTTLGVTRQWFSAEVSSASWWTNAAAGAGSGIAATGGTLYLQAGGTTVASSVSTLFSVSVPVAVTKSLGTTVGSAEQLILSAGAAAQRAGIELTDGTNPSGKITFLGNATPANAYLGAVIGTTNIWYANTTSLTIPVAVTLSLAGVAFNHTYSGASNYGLFRWINSSGGTSLSLGLDNSAGGVYAAGGYAGIFGTDGAFPIALVTNGVARLAIDSAGASTATTGANGARFRYGASAPYFDILSGAINTPVVLKYGVSGGAAPDLVFQSDGNAERVRFASSGIVTLSVTGAFKQTGTDSVLANGAALGLFTPSTHENYLVTAYSINVGVTHYTLAYVYVDDNGLPITVNVIKVGGADITVVSGVVRLTNNAGLSLTFGYNWQRLK